MIVSRTPLRISFIGGGSDLPAFYQEEPGCVVTTAINKHVYITVNKKFDSKIRASYSTTEIVDHLDSLQHDLIRETLRLTGVQKGVEITSVSDIPSEGTGMGSSSTYTVGLLNALYAYQGTHVPAEKLAKEACFIEIEACDKPIGKQDQYIGAYGGFNCIRFNPDDSVFVNPIVCKPNTKVELQKHLLLLYTGITRSANNILQQQQEKIRNNVNSRQTLRRMAQMAQETCNNLQNNDLHSFGQMLHESWLLKKSLVSTISSSAIDESYATARKHGAIGGKVLGAGGGGFLLLYAEPDYHARLISELPHLQYVPFEFDPEGSKIVYMR
jgi:D-glycero-alpha-D-manno-heptose-7-phosphate kinase